MIVSKTATLHHIQESALRAAADNRPEKWRVELLWIVETCRLALRPLEDDPTNVVKFKGKIP